MQLNEIIEEHSLESISKRTRIALDNLEALVNRDWGHLKKVQALGFISILEREYDVDLAELRKECRSYFESHAPREKRISVAAEEVAYRGRRQFSKVLVILLLVLFAYGSWYLFVAQNESLESNETAPRQESFYESVVKMADSWFKGETETSVDGNTTPPEEVIRGAWAKEKNGSGTTKTSEVNEDSADSTPEKRPGSPVGENGMKVQKSESTVPESMKEKSAPEEEKIIAAVKKEQAKAEKGTQKSVAEALPESTALTAEEEPRDEISSMIAQATGFAGEAPLETIPPSLKKEEEEMQRTMPSESGVSGQEKVGSTASRKAVDGPKSSSKPPVLGEGVVLFHPRSKVWVGYTELRTMKRTAKVTESDIPFDTSRGDYILTTGHGMVEFRNAKGELLKLNDGKKHYFMIAKDGVREMSHEAFQRLNKSKVW